MVIKPDLRIFEGWLGGAGVFQELCMDYAKRATVNQSTVSHFQSCQGRVKEELENVEVGDNGRWWEMMRELEVKGGECSSRIIFTFLP